MNRLDFFIKPYNRTVASDVPARLGPKAPALAFARAGPSQSRHSRLGPGPARLKPRLLAEKVDYLSLLIFINKYHYGRQVKQLNFICMLNIYLKAQYSTILFIKS